MKQEEELAYIAGFIDGEGCIGLYKTNCRKRFSYRLELQVSQITKEPLELIQKRFGGSIAYLKKSIKNPKHQDVYTLALVDKSAEQLLRAIYPYLIVKKIKAALLIKYRDLPRINNIENVKSRISGDIITRIRKSNESILERRVQVYEEIKALV